MKHEWINFTSQSNLKWFIFNKSIVWIYFHTKFLHNTQKWLIYGNNQHFRLSIPHFNWEWGIMLNWIVLLEILICNHRHKDDYNKLIKASCQIIVTIERTIVISFTYNALQLLQNIAVKSGTKCFECKIYIFKLALVIFTKKAL